jgi:hypothetical protein
MIAQSLSSTGVVGMSRSGDLADTPFHRQEPGELANILLGSIRDGLRVRLPCTVSAERLLEVVTVLRSC